MAVDFLCSTTEPIVQTKAGKLRGYKLGSTYHFLGVRYAEAKRWQMPEEVTPWEGVRDATGYGYTCPLMTPDRPDGDLFVPHHFWPQSEDCQYLNVWTQTLDETAKKPVMVWIHGGAYMAGSSIEMVAYDGVNMSVHGDCVVVSMNHRLNCIGYFDVSAFGEKYWNSGNVGNADLVVCLRWIRENIARFGGDPENITIFG
ncbi:MAG: carboxylesterase/lipase family protein, partial [Lachnospiraceae bacterium]|nr:carboxylesterase/lipase family protein [Lachnospiraceae bacterium]